MSIIMGIAKASLEVGAEFISNIATAEPFLTVRRSVYVTNITERWVEIESKGKKENLRLTITNPSHLGTIIEGMKSGQKVNMVLAGLESNRTGKREVLTSKIIEIGLEK
jgi:hypothetical protein